MVERILVSIGLVVLAGGFIFFAANVIWLGTKEFFSKYRLKNNVESAISKQKNAQEENKK